MLTSARGAARFLVGERLYERCRRLVLARSMTRFEPRIVSHVYGGVSLRVSLEDRVAEEWYDHDWPTEREIKKLSVRPGELVFDLGAHQAIVALLISEIVGDRGRVIAVEAEPHNVRVAKANLALNAANSVEVVHAAVASAPGRIRFAEGLNGRLMKGGRVGTVEVPAVTIDSLAAEYGHPDAVLIDVEGAEALALEGAAQTIRRGTRFMIEVHLGYGLEALGGQPDDLTRLLDGYRFEISARDVAEDGWQEGSVMTAASLLFAEPRSPKRSAESPVRHA